MTGAAGASIAVRDVRASDREWVHETLAAQGWDEVARRGELLRPEDHPAFVAELGGERAGLLVYVVEDRAWEILVLLATTPRLGVGTALVESVRSAASAARCQRLWVLTTNDNVDALRFYQRRGFRLDVLRPGAAEHARATLKRSIPATGEYGIPLRDEIELVADLHRRREASS